MSSFRVTFARLFVAGARVVALSPELREALDKFVTENKIVLFMKGNKQFPQCGFSNTTVQILNTFNVPYETVDVLAEDTIRQGLKEYSSWPTFPQVYIDGEFFGGCDIMIGTSCTGSNSAKSRDGVNTTVVSCRWRRTRLFHDAATRPRYSHTHYKNCACHLILVV